jgi:hypothetical protein
MSTALDQHPSWAEAIAAGIDTYRAELRKQARPQPNRIAQAHAALGKGDLAGCASVLAKYNPDQPRDEHGRWTSGGGSSSGSSDGSSASQPVRLADAAADVATRIAGVAREMESALVALRALRGAPGPLGVVLTLATSLLLLHRELRELPAAAGKFTHEAKASMLAARDRVARLLDWIRQLRGAQNVGKRYPTRRRAKPDIRLPSGAVTMWKRLSDDEQRRRNIVQARLDQLKDRLNARLNSQLAAGGPRSWQQMEA